MEIELLKGKKGRCEGKRRSASRAGGESLRKAYEHDEGAPMR